MFKKLLFISTISALSFPTYSQAVSDSVTLGAGYTDQVFYQLSSGNKTTASSSDWDLQFFSSLFSASIRVNSGFDVELYEAVSTDTANFITSTLDTSSLTILRDGYATWETDAFTSQQTGHPNYGWGKYQGLGNIVGFKVYAIKLTSGVFKKIWIRDFKTSGTLTFTVADLNGANAFTKTINRSDYVTKRHFYYDIENDSIYNSEPGKTQWELVFRKYSDQAGPQFYNVTGALTNDGLAIAQVNNTAIATAKADSNKVILLNDLAWELKISDPKQAKTYSTAFRSFAKSFASPISNGLNINELPYESILTENSTFEKNTDVDLFNIKIKRSQKSIIFVDPDLFPTLFKKDSVLHHVLLNIESSSQQKPIAYSVIAGLKSQLSDISKWPDFSEIKALLNQDLENVHADSIKKALVDYEKRLYAKHPDKRLDQLSTSFRHHLFTYGLTSPELNKEKDNFIPSFHQSGNLKFKPIFTIKTKGSEFNIEGFDFPKILPIGSVGECCLNQLEIETKLKPIDPSDITKLFEMLMIIEQEGYTDARLLFARKPQDIVTYHVNNGLKDIEDIIIKRFSNEKLARISIVREFIDLCDTPTKNGKLIRELEIESNITPKEVANTLPLGTYSKVNGKKRGFDYEFNLSKLKGLVKPNSTLSTALNGLKVASSKTPVPSSTLSSIELTLGHIVDTNNDANLIRHILVNPISELSQRDFRVGFAQLEDIIDVHDFKVKAARSQALRTFLSKYAGKINNQIELKNCGFSSRFSASSENNAQKLIEPVDENGQPLPSPILDKHLSLHELKKKVSDYLEKPINQILDACIEEIAHYNKLVTCISKYTATDKNGNYSLSIREYTSIL